MEIMYDNIFWQFPQFPPPLPPDPWQCFLNKGKRSLFSILASIRSSFLSSCDFFFVSVDSFLVCIECEIQNCKSVCVCVCAHKHVLFE